jgi:hypothetical protein
MWFVCLAGIIEFDEIVAIWQAMQGKETLLMGLSILVIYLKGPMTLCWLDILALLGC